MLPFSNESVLTFLRTKPADAAFDTLDSQKCCLAQYLHWAGVPFYGAGWYIYIDSAGKHYNSNRLLGEALRGWTKPWIEPGHTFGAVLKNFILLWANDCIRDCEKALERDLSPGERRDLLMDNTPFTREEIVWAVAELERIGKRVAACQTMPPSASGFAI